MTDSSWPEAARAWLEALGCPDPDAVLSQAPPFSPRTLKQVFTAVMDLGRRAGRLGETMALLGQQEAAFRQLREEIGIPRAAPPEHLVPAVVLQAKPEGWIHPGRWVPDILDRAAGRDLVGTSGAPSLPAGSGPWGGEGVHLFVIGGAVLPSDLHPGSRLHALDGLDWLVPGPGLVRAVFEAASCLHGIPLSAPEVYSLTPNPEP